ncbi:MAG: rod shape-determining protein MreC [Candidatus Omnitrophica bacterium]|nr:rod shape-determining protein MreC [Candidatus Omnitrophota bacterium]
MYLPSKIKSKYLIFSACALIVLILPLKIFLENFFLSFSRRLLLSPHQYVLKVQELEKRTLVYSLRIRQLEHLQTENERLRKILGFKKEKKINLIGADIIAFDPSSWRRVIFINVGKTSGVSEGSYAVNEEGYLVGRIAEVRDAYSRLILLNDPDFSVSAFVGEGSYGLLRGGLEGIRVLYIDDSEAVRIGDKVWMKMPSSNFPLYIGEVKRLIQNAESLFLEVDVKLFSDGTIPNKIFILK